MAALVASDGILYGRQLLQDSNTTFPGATDTEYLRVMNDWYMTIYKVYERRPKKLTLIASLAASTRESDTDSGATPFEILSVHRTAGGADTPMEGPYDWTEVKELQTLYATTGAPLRWSAFKQTGATNKEVWTMAFHPIPDATYVIGGYCYVYPTALTTADTPYLGDAEAYWMYRLMASTIAPTLGRPELIEGILAPIDKGWLSKVQTEARRKDPQ